MGKFLLFQVVIFGIVGCGITVPADGTVAEPFWLSDARSGDAFGDAGSADAGSLDSAVAPGTDEMLPGSEVTATVGTPGGPSSSYYAMWQQTRVLSHNPAPFGDEWQVSRTTTIGLVRMDWLGNNGQAWIAPCAVHTNEVASSQLTYPSSFINALTEGPFAVKRDATTITQPGKTQWVGTQKGYEGDMPSVGDGNHPALSDDDADGHPGVTIYINMPFFGDQAIYVAERAKSSWIAHAQPDGTFVALPQTVGVKVTVGATESILVAPTNDKELPGEAPEELRLTPTTAETGCAALLAAPDLYTNMSWPP